MIKNELDIIIFLFKSLNIDIINYGFFWKSDWCIYATETIKEKVKKNKTPWVSEEQPFWFLVPSWSRWRSCAGLPPPRHHPHPLQASPHYRTPTHQTSSNQRFPNTSSGENYYYIFQADTFCKNQDPSPDPDQVPEYLVKCV